MTYKHTHGYAEAGPVSVGCIDGGTMIEMNNLAVGYFPTEAPEIGVYPPPVPEPRPITEQGSGTSCEVFPGDDRLGQ